MMMMRDVGMVIKNWCPSFVEMNFGIGTDTESSTGAFPVSFIKGRGCRDSRSVCFFSVWVAYELCALLCPLLGRLDLNSPDLDPAQRESWWSVVCRRANENEPENSRSTQGKLGEVEKHLRTRGDYLRHPSRGGNERIYRSSPETEDVWLLREEPIDSDTIIQIPSSLFIIFYHCFGREFVKHLTAALRRERNPHSVIDSL